MSRKSIGISVVFIAAILMLSTFYVSALSNNFSNYKPSSSGTTTVSNPDISTYVKSANDLDDQSLNMKINGTQVNAQFSYKVERKEGTIFYKASDLKDGANTVEVSINDNAGNTLNDSWSFIVKEAPKFSNLSPADKSEQASLSQLSATIKDNTAVDWSSVKLKLNNSYVSSASININPETGTVTYNKNFASGSYTAALEAKDINGNLSTKTWSFIVDNTAPILDYFSGLTNGATLTNSTLNISARLKDLTEIKDNVSLMLDGTPVIFDFKYEGYQDYSDYVVTSKKTAYITYTGTIRNGEHTLSLYAEDKWGNSMTRNWKFTVAVKPVVSDATPFKYGVDNLKPAISAVVTSPNGSVNADSIVVKLDGQPLDFQYDAVSGLVSYTPSENLENEAYHTVYVSATDLSGISITKEWKFYTNTYPDMKDSNISNCTSCHQANSFTGSNSDLENVHSKKLYFNGTHSNNRCDNCHNYISVPANCSQCHEDPDGTFAYAPHGSTPSIKYQPTNVDPTTPLRVTENRETNDCILCHQPGSQVKGYTGYQSTPTRLLNNHDLPELHKANNEPDCTGCHAKSLTHEHARDGRQDANGNPITCNTCHQSTNPAVVQAIKDKNTSCTSCHSRDTVHKDTHSKCANCHSKGSYEDSRHAN